MNPEVEAGLLRLRAAMKRAEAAQLDLASRAVELVPKLIALREAFDASVAQEVAEHPDLAELNIRMDALYDLP